MTDSAPLDKDSALLLLDLDLCFMDHFSVPLNSDKPDIHSDCTHSQQKKPHLRCKSKPTGKDETVVRVKLPRLLSEKSDDPMQSAIEKINHIIQNDATHKELDLTRIRNLTSQKRAVLMGKLMRKLKVLEASLEHAQTLFTQAYLN